jgi:beta-N-acetylhexosaminidase
MQGIYRRRRLLAVVGALAALVVVVLALAAGSGGSGATRNGGGPQGTSGASAPAAGGATTGGATSARPAAAVATAFTPDPRATTLAGRLALDRQVAQLFLVSLDGTSPSAVTALGKLDWGGVLLDSANVVSPGQIGALAQAVALGTGIPKRTPPLIAVTQEGGTDTAIKGLAPESEPAAVGSGKPSSARAQAMLAARQLRGLHLNMTIAPLADVDIPDGALSGRLFSGDPAVVARYAAAEVGGYAAGRLISAVGHFPGAGAASADPDQMTATVGGGLTALRARDLVPFAAIAASVPVIVMSNAAYAAYDGVTPASLLPQAVTLLRDQYHFAGVVMSDDLDATLQPTGDGPGSVAVQALDAGDDLLFISGPPSEHQAAYDAVLAAARRSPAVRARVRDALLRVLSLKARFGLLGRAPR